MFLLFLAFVACYQCDTFTLVDLDPYMPQSIVVNFSDSPTTCIKYRLKTKYYKFGYTAIYNDEPHNILISSYDSAMKNQYPINQIKDQKYSLIISNSLEGSFFVQSINKKVQSARFIIAQIASQDSSDFMHIFDIGTSNTFTLDTQNALTEIKRLGYVKMQHETSDYANFMISSNENIEKSMNVYVNNVSKTVNSKINNFIFRKSHIGFFLDATNLSNAPSLTIKYYNSSLNHLKSLLAASEPPKTTIYIIVGVIGAYYVIGIICLALTCIIGKSHFNRIYGSPCGNCLCCCTQCDNFEKMRDFYQSHPSYYYSDYNICGCRKCVCQETHCGESCYTCCECCTQNCYSRYYNGHKCFGRFMFNFLNIFLFPVFSIVTACHLCHPSKRDLEYEDNIDDKFDYHPPINISKFYKMYKLKGKEYHYSKDSPYAKDSESSDIEHVQEEVHELSESSGTENSALSDVYQKPANNVENQKDKQEIEEEPAKPITVPKIKKVQVETPPKTPRRQNMFKLPELPPLPQGDSPLKPLELGNARQLSFTSSPLAMGAQDNSIIVLKEIDSMSGSKASANKETEQSKSYETKPLPTLTNTDILPIMADSQPTTPQDVQDAAPIPQITQDQIVNFKEALEKKDDKFKDEFGLINVGRRGKKHRRRTFDTYRRSMELFAPPTSFDSDIIDSSSFDSGPVSESYVPTLSDKDKEIVHDKLPVFDPDALPPPSEFKDSDDEDIIPTPPSIEKKRSLEASLKQATAMHVPEKRFEMPEKTTRKRKGTKRRNSVAVEVVLQKQQHADLAFLF